MSVQILNDVWFHSRATGNDRLVLLVLADHGNDERLAWPGVKLIARKCGGIEDRTVQRCLRRLVEMGEIEVAEPGGRGGRHRKSAVYRILVGRQSAILDESGVTAEAEGVTAEAAQGDSNGRSRVTPVSPEPSVEPPSEPPEEPAPPVSPPQPAFTVDRKRVTMPEHRKAQAILDAYNEVAGGTPFTSKEWLAKIVMRDREHPDLTVEQHHEIIERNFRAPWWKGDPSPSVIYGNAALFEQCMRSSGTPVPRTHAEEIDAAIRRLGQYADGEGT